MTRSLVWALGLLGGLVGGCRRETARPEREAAPRIDRPAPVRAEQAGPSAPRGRAANPWRGPARQEALTRLRVAALGGQEDAWRLLDAQTGGLLAQGGELSWGEPATPGRLVMPLAAYVGLRLARIQPDERLACRGDRDMPAGHGRLDVLRALEVGCESFFAVLATRLRFSDLLLATRLARIRGPVRPPGQLERWALMSCGQKWKLGTNDLVRVALWLARPDPGDRAKQLVRRGCRAAVRSGFLQGLGTAQVAVAGYGGRCSSAGGGLAALVAWAPWRDPVFVLLVRHRRGLGPAIQLGRRIFEVLAGVDVPPSQP